MQSHIQKQRVKKQQDSSHFQLKAATQGGISIRSTEVQSGNKRELRVERSFRFLCRCCVAHWATPQMTLIVLIPTDNKSDQYVNHVINANPSPKDTVSVGDKQLPAFSSTFGLINADVK